MPGTGPRRHLVDTAMASWHSEGLELLVGSSLQDF